MRHTAHGWWIEDAGLAAELPTLRGEERADVLVVGGGYTGLWTAWHLLELEPEARVAVLEAEGIGTGPSGRNGGFVNSMWFSLGALCRRYGERAGLEMARAASDSCAHASWARAMCSPKDRVIVRKVCSGLSSPPTSSRTRA